MKMWMTFPQKKKKKKKKKTTHTKTNKNQKLDDNPQDVYVFFSIRKNYCHKGRTMHLSVDQPTVSVHFSVLTIVWCRFHTRFKKAWHIRMFLGPKLLAYFVIRCHNNVTRSGASLCLVPYESNTGNYRVPCLIQRRQVTRTRFVEKSGTCLHLHPYFGFGNPIDIDSIGMTCKTKKNHHKTRFHVFGEIKKKEPDHQRF